MFKTWTTCAVSMKYVSSRLQLNTGCQHVKHGPRTILLKLLTILLSGSPFRWWTRQRVTAGLIPQQSQLRRSTLHARPLFRAISARTVELVGINQFQMFATVNTKNSLGNKDQVISGVVFSSRAAGTRAPDSGLKLQAASHKLQAPSDKHPNQSNKHQAPSHKQQAPRS